MVRKARIRLTSTNYNKLEDVCTELKGIAPESFSIKRRSYTRHQFPDPLTLQDGSTIAKPSTW